MGLSGAIVEEDEDENEDSEDDSNKLIIELPASKTPRSRPKR